MVSDAMGASVAFLRFEHGFRDGLHTYTARADSTLVNEVWPGLRDLAPYPDDPELNPMDRFCISNFAGERLAVWRAIAWTVTEGLIRCGIPQWDRDAAAATLGIDRRAMRLVRWEYDIDHEDSEDGDLGFVAAKACVRIHPPPDRWEIEHSSFAGIFPLSSFDELTGLDCAVFTNNPALVTVFGLARDDRFDALCEALNAPTPPVLAEILRPGEMFVSMATVRDAYMTHWTNRFTVKTLAETDIVYRTAARYTNAYHRYLNRLGGIRTLSDFGAAATELLAGTATSLPERTAGEDRGA